MTDQTSKYPFFSYQLFGEQLDSFAMPTCGKEPLLITTINAHSFYVADQDAYFRTALEQSQILLPDGVGVVYANWLINRSRLRRISGMDMFLHILKKLEAEKDPSQKRIFFLGATDSTLEKIRNKIKKDFPSLEVAVYSPPFKPEFTDEDIRLMVAKINAFKPFALFIGMTAPKQEKWSYKHKDLLDARIICSIGAVFDFYSGKVKRPGRFWRAMGLEWFIRFLREPKRLWKRSFISLPYFLREVFREAIRKRMKK